jgi:hypothetical protein
LQVNFISWNITTINRRILSIYGLIVIGNGWLWSEMHISTRKNTVCMCPAETKISMYSPYIFDLGTALVRTAQAWAVVMRIFVRIPIFGARFQRLIVTFVVVVCVLFVFCCFGRTTFIST